VQSYDVFAPFYDASRATAPTTPPTSVADRRTPSGSETLLELACGRLRP
jgi:hypothetical protein